MTLNIKLSSMGYERFVVNLIQSILFQTLNEILNIKNEYS